MAELLIIADDLTGAMDSGIQFSKQGIATCVIVNAGSDFEWKNRDVQVLVWDAETRHIKPKEAYDVIFDVAVRARKAGISYIYKKTDSVLRGNIGAELDALLAASGYDMLPFIPAYPKNGRITKRGIHYVQDVPVAESVFGRDPFDPIRCSEVASIIAQQTDVPVSLEAEACKGVSVFNAVSDDDLWSIGQRLGKEKLHICAGSAGFASIIAKLLPLKKKQSPPQKLRLPLLMVCGSLNPITLQQLDMAEDCGVSRFHLRPEQKFDADWLESPACNEILERISEIVGSGHSFILDAGNAADNNAASRYIKNDTPDFQQVRIRVAVTLGLMVKRILDKGADATLFCSGGDTLLAVIRALGATQMLPLCELSPGIVLSAFTYMNRQYQLISKSGGFGTPDFLCRLLKTGKEDSTC